MGYNYAEIYADAVRESLVPAVSDELGFRRDSEALAPLLLDDHFEVEFRRNADVDAHPGHFLGFRTIIEIASRDDAENRDIVALVERITAVVRLQGYSAVPVADFESEIAVAQQVVDVSYYAKVDERFSREDPRGLVRRRDVEGVVHDEAFTRNLRWEPTEYFERYRLGHNDVDHVQITKDEADSFIERMSRKLAQGQ